MTTYTPILLPTKLTFEDTVFRSYQGNEVIGDEVDAIPNWAAILFAIGIIVVIGGLIWVIADGDKRGAMVTAAGAAAVFGAIKRAEHSSKRTASTWKPL